MGSSNWGLLPASKWLQCLDKIQNKTFELTEEKLKWARKILQFPQNLGGVFQSNHPSYLWRSTAPIHDKADVNTAPNRSPPMSNWRVCWSFNALGGRVPEKFSLSWTKTTSLVRLAFRFPGCSHRLFTKIQSHTKKERRWLDRFHFIPKLLRILSICHEDDKMKTNFKKKLLFFCSFFRWLGLRVSHAPWSYSWCATGVRDRVTS